MRRFFLITFSLTVLVLSAFATPHPAAADAYLGHWDCASVNGHYSKTSGNGNIDFEYVYLKAGETVTVTLISTESGIGKVDFWSQVAPYNLVIANPAMLPGQTLTYTTPIDQELEFEIHDSLSYSNAITADIACGAGAGPVITMPVTMWGAVNIGAVAWQFQDSTGKWWWFNNSGTNTLIQTPIEYRDRTNDAGKVIQHYAMSRLIVRIGTAPTDPTMYKVFDAATLAPLHQVWIEIGDEAAPTRKAVFIP